jgi:O-succinylbenzoic acid--CoA ligase
VDEFLRRAARHRGDHPALIDADTGRTWSYRALDVLVDRIAAELDDRGIGPGERIGLVAVRRPASIAAIWATFRVGAVLVPVSPGEPEAGVVDRFDRAGVSRCLVPDGAADVPEAVRPVRIEIGATAGTADGKESVPRTGQDLDATRVVLFTSGTTGTPTGVRLTGRNLGASAAATVARLGADGSDRWLLDLPLHHAGGFSIPIRTAMLGATTVLNRSFEARLSAAAMRDYDVTGVSLVPTMLEQLLEGAGLPDGLSFALIGGAATPPALVERALEADVPIYVSYGMTETASGLATATPEELRTEPHTVGRPVTAATVTIRKESGDPVEAGETGEITVSGPIVSPGSIDGESREVGEPYTTGDLGYLSADGRLFVTGRIDDLIVTGGENVAPATVEAALGKLDGIEDAAVFGVPDDRWGERIEAAVVPAGAVDCSLETIRDRLGGRLADHERPKAVHVVDRVPRTASGTVDREALRAMIDGERSDRSRD